MGERRILPALIALTALSGAPEGCAPSSTESTRTERDRTEAEKREAARRAVFLDTGVGSELEVAFAHMDAAQKDAALEEWKRIIVDTESRIARTRFHIASTEHMGNAMLEKTKMKLAEPAFIDAVKHIDAYLESHPIAKQYMTRETVLGIIFEESDFHAEQVTGRARGLMQVVPSKKFMREHPHIDLLDPAQNIAVGLDEISYNLSRTHSLAVALQGNNEGLPTAEKQLRTVTPRYGNQVTVLDTYHTFHQKSKEGTAGYKSSEYPFRVSIYEHYFRALRAETERLVYTMNGSEQHKAQSTLRPPKRSK